jgi:hypothetical protein
MGARPPSTPGPKKDQLVGVPKHDPQHSNMFIHQIISQQKYNIYIVAIPSVEDCV